MREQPNWWPKLIRAAEAHGLTTTAALAVAEIRHDNWCRRLQGTGRCNCDPDVELVSRTADGGE